MGETAKFTARIYHDGILIETDIAGKTTREVIEMKNRLADEAVQRHLVALGWTPPLARVGRVQEFTWPSDAARAQDSELNRVCEHLEDVLDERDQLIASNAEEAYQEGYEDAGSHMRSRGYEYIQDGGNSVKHAKQYANRIKNEIYTNGDQDQ